MTKRLAASLLSAGIIVAGGSYIVATSVDREAAAATALVREYCIDCHNDLEFAGSLRLDDKDPANVGHDAETWERVVRKIATGMMPPADMPRPERETLDAFVRTLEERLDRAAVPDPDLEAPAARRLNRSEYANAIRDLLHLDIDVTTLLPLDDSSEGFDNMATALSVSPAHIESYVSAAMKISRRAIGDRSAPRTQVTYTTPQTLDQMRHLAGLPLGTRGGLRVEHDFPLDATYLFRIRPAFRFPREARIDVTIDGRSVDTESAGLFRLDMPAGPHTITAAIVDTRRPVGVDDIYGNYEMPGAIQSIEIDGPLEPTGVGDTPSRRRVLSCVPADPAEERACAEEIVATLATRAFRRPVAREELQALLDFYDDAVHEGFEAGIQHALARILVDPRFLYRIEAEPASAAPGARFAIDDFELASRLSFFLWSSIPDDDLLSRAAGGELGDERNLLAETARMLADPRAEALIDNFAAQWLFLRALDSVTPDAGEYDENLRLAMEQETKRLFGAIMEQDLSVLRLLDADFTFVDERLAEHYGLPGVHGSHFRRIALPPENPRRGILGHASLLTVTSVTNRTSPVIRGSWILENLLGTPPPVPPPNVETTLEGDDGQAVTATVRQRLEAHRSNPVCASCHAIMDPIGFTLENFDLIGRWRDTDGGLPIDATAALADGTPIDGPGGLRDALLDRRQAYVTTVTEKLMTYALGRPVEYFDMPAIRAIVTDAAAHDYRFSALVRGVVTSDPFRTRVRGAPEQ